MNIAAGPIAASAALSGFQSIQFAVNLPGQFKKAREAKVMRMLSPLLLLLCFAKAPASSESAEHAVYQVMLSHELERRSSEVPAKAAERREAEFRERQFAGKFNDLIKSLLDFADHYNSEHTMDLKRIKQVKRAWRDLEKTDTWFRIEDDKARDEPAGARSGE